MSVEILTYGALGARLKISPEAARSLAIDAYGEEDDEAG